MLQRWYPVTNMRRAENTVERLGRGFGFGPFLYSGNSGSGLLPLDVEESDDNVVVRASLPGAAPEDIEVTIEDGALTITSGSKSESETKEGHYLIRERRLGESHRSIRLPDYVDADSAESSYENGVLAITFQKHEEKKARQIEVKVA